MPTPDDYAPCRGPLKHAWFEADSDWTPMFGTPYTSRCERCGSERRYVFDVNGNLASRRYIYPPNYRYAKGEMPTVQDFRLMAIAARLQNRRATKAAAKKAAG